MLDFSPIRFVLRLLQHILDALGKRKSLVQLLSMHLSNAAEDLELAASPRRFRPVLSLVQVDIVVMELQERAHLVDVDLGSNLHSVAPLGRLERALVLEFVEV